MNGTIPATRDDIEQLRRETGADSLFTDALLDDVMFRLVALEEIVAARWPRSVLVRRRLAKAIRRSVAEIDGTGFTWKRLNTIATGWQDRPRPPLRETQRPAA